MSTVQTEHIIAPANSKKMLLAMVGIGILCAFLIVVTFELTLPQIEKNKAEALEKAIFKVLPGIVKKKTFQLDENNNFIDVSSEEKKTQVVYAGYDENDNLVGVAVEASGLGFADVLRVLYGYSPDKETVVGFYVLQSKETPGLGDKIEKDLDFLENFKALDVSLADDNSRIKNKVVPVKKGTKVNPWEVDGITGATISSRAIGNILGASTENWIPIIYKNKNTFSAKE